MNTSQVMVALDGSDKGRRALSVALGLSEIAQAAVHLVRVLQPPPARIANQAGLIGVDPMALQDRQAAERALADAARDLTSHSRWPISWEVLEGDDVPAVLTRAAEAHDVTAVVMGTRAASAAGLAIVGSVADRVMRECARPVVLVPPGAADMSDKRIQLHRMLVPLDGSALSERSIDYLLGLPHTEQLEFVIVGVVHNPQDVASVGRRLHLAADRFHARSIEATPRVIVGGDAPKSIVAAVREFLADMIVMSTRGEGGVRRLVLGSVAEGVVRASEVPVLLLTPTMLAAGEEARSVASVTPAG